MESTGQGNDFKLIPMVEMKTRNPVPGYFGSDFRQSVIIAELWRHEVASFKNEKFWPFWGKRPL